MNTYYIDCNKANSKDKNNLDNSQFTTELKKSISLTKGTQISIQSSFINQKGITGQSIEIDEDFNETIKFVYYKSDGADLLPNESTNFNQNPYVIPTISKGTADAVNTRKRLFNQSYLPTDTAINQNISNLLAFGGTEQPLIMLKYVDNGSVSLADIAVGSASIKIKKGIYGISQIADLITNQLNEVVDLEGNPRNHYQESIQEGFFSDGNLQLGTNSLITTRNIPNSSKTANIPKIANVANQDYLFTDVKTANTLREARINLNDGTGLLFSDSVSGAGVGNSTAFCQTYINVADPSDVEAYNPMKRFFYVGTPYMSIDFNEESSSFEINGLHTPYQFQSHDRNYNEMVLKEKNGVYYRRQTDQSKQFLTAGMSEAFQELLVISNMHTPISRIGGVIVHNWGYETALKYGTKKGIHKFDVVLEKYKFKEFFNEEKEAIEAWKKTLWYKLGFSYEQLNSESSFENVNYYNGEATTLMGTTTNAQLDPTIIQEISTRTNISHLTSIPPYPQLNSGTLFSNNLFDVDLPVNGAGAGNSGKFLNSIFGGAVMFPMEVEGRPIKASNLPTLSEVGYYLITSDILDGYNDIVKNGDPISLLGVVAKSSLSNQDFIYSNQDIINTITNEKIINSIKIRFLNPDMTSPQFDPNSSVILRIDVPIPEPINSNPLIGNNEEEDKKDKKK